MILVSSSSSSLQRVRSDVDGSSRASFSGSFHVLVVLLVLGFALLGLPRASSLSPSLKVSNLRTPSSSTAAAWNLRVAAVGVAEKEATATTTTTTAASVALMEAQAGGNTSNRRRRKQRIRNSDNANNRNNNDGSSRAVFENARKNQEDLPDPLVPFESVESVKLVGGDDETAVRVEVVVRNDDDDKNGPVFVDPRDLHQTSDFDLWMALRKHVVDVSASQLSVVLGTNYFTSREQLLRDKILARRTAASNKIGESASDDDDRTIVLGEDDKTSSSSSNNNSKSNSKACAWGIKMEPLAFAQYSDVVEATNQNDDDESAPRNFVEETGMHLLRHTDPETQKTYVFGASPDGMVTEHKTREETQEKEPSVGLLEIKSLWGRRHKKSLPEFTSCPSRFYDQIQGQMAICDKDWCDLMVFIPPNTGGVTAQKKNGKRKGKSAKKRKKQAMAAAASDQKNRKNKGRNYSIVRVKRNEGYWKDTVLPALIEFCDEVEAGILPEPATEAEGETTTGFREDDVDEDQTAEE